MVGPFVVVFTVTFANRPNAPSTAISSGSKSLMEMVMVHYATTANTTVVGDWQAAHAALTNSSWPLDPMPTLADPVFDVVSIVASADPLVTTAPTSAPTPPTDTDDDQPTWLWPVVAAGGGVILLGVVVAVVYCQWHKRPTYKK